MRRSRAATTVKHELALVKTEPSGLDVKAGVSVVSKAEPLTGPPAWVAAATFVAEPSGSEACGAFPFPGYARPLPEECVVTDTLYRQMFHKTRHFLAQSVAPGSPLRRCTQQAARDALATLHGAPDVGSISQRSVLDSLVTRWEPKTNCSIR